MKRNKILFAVFIILVFLVMRQFTFVGHFVESSPMDSIVERLFRMVLIVIFLLIFLKPKDILSALGLTRPVRGLVVGLAITLPMGIGYAIVSQLNPDISAMDLLNQALMPGLYEEFVYRAFLFGLLFRFCGWGFIPAGLLSALIFGGAHLYQANDLGSALGIFAVTGIGGLWFAWLYIEWDKNLFVPIVAHILMNAYWGIFSMGTNALGGVYGNVFRSMTIALSIFLTVRYIKKRKTFLVNKRNLFLNT